MAYPSSRTPSANPVSIISPPFCAPNPIELAVLKKVKNITDGNFVVADSNDNILFKVKEAFFTIHDCRVLLDAAGNPIISFKHKLKNKLDVLLANNTKEDVCEFKINRSWPERSCVVYAGGSSTIVAQMHKKHTVESVLVRKDKFMVTVHPNIDYAFIMALTVIVNGINTQ